jgi:hypothetical protein
VTKPIRGLPLDARPLNSVLHEWWRRLQDPALTLVQFRQALIEERLVAWNDEGMVPSDYWEKARFEFDRKEPLSVIVVVDGEEVRAKFYVSAGKDQAAHPQKGRAAEPAPRKQPEPANKPPPGLRGWQGRRIWRAAKELWPPDGLIPWETGTADASQRIDARLEAEKTGKALPSEDTYQRAIRILRPNN